MNIVIIDLAGEHSCSGNQYKRILRFLSIRLGLWGNHQQPTIWARSSRNAITTWPRVLSPQHLLSIITDQLRLILQYYRLARYNDTRMCDVNAIKKKKSL